MPSASRYSRLVAPDPAAIAAIGVGPEGRAPEVGVQEHAGRVDHRAEQLRFQRGHARLGVTDDIVGLHGLSEFHAFARGVDGRARATCARNACGMSDSSDERTRSTLGSCRRGSIPAAYAVRDPRPPAST